MFVFPSWITPIAYVFAAGVGITPIAYVFAAGVGITPIAYVFASRCWNYSNSEVF